MRKLMVILAAVSVVVAGCGGGGGGTSAISPAVSLAVPSGAAPTGVTPTVAYKSATELPDLAGKLFVAAADCLPAGTDFSAPVTLDFHLTTPLPTNAHPLLFQTDANGDWIQVPGIHPISVSSDRMTLSVNVSQFSDYRYYAVINVPVP